MAASKDDNIENAQFFEGVEKLLEIWFTSSNGEDRKQDLREIPRWVVLTPHRSLPLRFYFVSTNNAQKKLKPIHFTYSIITFNLVLIYIYRYINLT